MKKYFRILFLCFLIFLISACSKPITVPPVPMPTEWRYEKDAIRLNLQSDYQLNLYQGIPHTLVVCVYHLRDPNAFQQLTEEKEGLSKLLDCGRFDSSVTFSKRLIIHPGQVLAESLDRTEGAKYVGMVAGYYNLEKERAVRFFPIPVIEEKSETTILTKPRILSIELYLGPQQIRELGGE